MGSCASNCRVGDLHHGATFMEKEVIAALEKKKRELDQLNDKPTFNRIMLKFGKIKRIMGALEDIFDSLCEEGEKGLGVNQLRKLMHSLSVELSRGEVEELFKIADVDRSGKEHNRLDMQEFLVAIAVGYMLEAIPALRDREGEFSRDLSMIRQSETFATGNFRASESRAGPDAATALAPGESAAKDIARPLSRDQPATVASPTASRAEPAARKSTRTGAREEKNASSRRASRGDLLQTWRSKRVKLRESEMMRPSYVEFDNDEVSASATALDYRDSVVSLFDEGHIFNGDDIRHAVHLIICAYLLFDTTCRGFILKQDITALFRREGKGEGAPAYLSTERWAEMDTDGDGRIMFQEFVFSFAKWMDLGDTEEEESKDPRSRPQAKGSSRGRF